MEDRRRRKREAQFTILDALCWATLPLEHQTASIAAYLIDEGCGFPIPTRQVQSIAELLSDNSSEENELVDDIIGEICRQIRIKIARLDERRKRENSMAMGSQLGRKERINRVAARIFGDVSKWMPVGRVTPKIQNPHFNWLYRDADKTIVAGVDGTVLDEVITGFVFSNKKGIVRFGRLPAQARSVRDLYTFLGLRPRLSRNKPVKIDWGHKAFIVAGTNYLPWVSH